MIPYKKLLLEAKKASLNSYSPYSKIKVGAAVLAGGQIFTGSNVENASFGLTVCAERNAVFSAVNSGNKKIEAAALFMRGRGSAVPCGACLQVIAEFAGDIEIIVPSGSASYKTIRLSRLLPRAFKLK